jgi:hypothetical protein
MIGHYLLTLTPEQEERVLTEHMGPGGREKCVGAVPCLMEVVENDRNSMWMFWQLHRPLKWMSPWEAYDRLCNRFGRVVVNRAIRNRVLTNQARRLLKQEPVCA